MSSLEPLDQSSQPSFFEDVGLVPTVHLGDPSAWTFDTYGTGGGSYVVTASGGRVTLKDPDGQTHKIWYGGVGAGLSWGLKIPKIGRVKFGKNPNSAAVGPEKFPSTGTVYRTTAHPGELTRDDFQGICVFIEGGGGLIIGGSGTALLAGMRPDLWTSFLAATPPTMSLAVNRLFNSARAVILMAGVNVGVQAQVGAAVLIGYMH